MGHLEAELRGRQRGDGQPVAHSEVHNASGVVTLGQGNVCELGGLVDGSTTSNLVNLHQEPNLVLWLLEKSR